jgi:hypothetical protein
MGFEGAFSPRATFHVERAREVLRLGHPGPGRGGSSRAIKGRRHGARTGAPSAYGCSTWNVPGRCFA